MSTAGGSGHAVEQHVRDPVAALVRAVGDTLETVDRPGRLDDERQPMDYLGDVVGTAFNGSEQERVELLARLVHLAAAAGDPCDPVGPRRWLDRLARLLRDWDAERRRATAPPRPRPTELEIRVARLQLPDTGQPLLLTEFIALDTAMLTAIHLLAGATSVERALTAVAELTPLLDLARSELLAADGELGDVFRHPGATLAYLEQLSREWVDLLDGRSDEEARRLLTRLPLDMAAALLFVDDAYEQRADHDHGWLQVRDRAVEAITTGRLADDPAAVDASAALEETRSVALTLAGHWLDELRGETENRAAALRPRVIDACSRCLVTAWAQRRVGHEG